MVGWRVPAHRPAVNEEDKPVLRHAFATLIRIKGIDALRAQLEEPKHKEARGLDDDYDAICREMCPDASRLSA
jgi:hypothetical protein